MMNINNKYINKQYMENIKNFLLEKLSVNENFNREPEFKGHTLSEIAELIYDLFTGNDFANGRSGGHCSGFKAIRNNGLDEVIEFHDMYGDIEDIVLDGNTSDSDDFWEFFFNNEKELTKLILQYE